MERGRRLIPAHAPTKPAGGRRKVRPSIRVRPRKTRRPAVQFELPLAKYTASAQPAQSYGSAI